MWGWASVQKKYIENTDGKLTAYKIHVQKREELLKPKIAEGQPRTWTDSTSSWITRYNQAKISLNFCLAFSL